MMNYYAFIIVLIFLYSPRACMTDCWSEDASVYNTVIKKLLPRDKFLEIFRHIHYSIPPAPPVGLRDFEPIPDISVNSE